MRYEKTENCVNIVIFATGDGVNAENIIQYFEKFLDVNISCVITNNEKEGIINRIRRYKINTYVEKYYKNIDQILTHHNIHYIVLDNYLDKLPPNFCTKYKWKIINIHPALLPRFGGKGMYGDNVHKAVKKSSVDKTGITIHFVDQDYNTGSVIFQKEIPITESDTVEDIKSYVRTLELKYYPKIIEKLIKGTYKYLYEKS